MIEYLLVTYTLLTLDGGHHAAVQMVKTPNSTAQIARASAPTSGAPINSREGVHTTSSEINQHGQARLAGKDRYIQISQIYSPSDPIPEVAQQKNQFDPATGSDDSTPRYPSIQPQTNNMHPSRRSPPGALSKQNRRQQSSQIARQWWYLHKNP